MKILYVVVYVLGAATDSGVGATSQQILVDAKVCESMAKTLTYKKEEKRGLFSISINSEAWCI